MAAKTKSAWQYSKWVVNIARNMRITLPTGAELAAVKVFMKAIYNPADGTGTRPWLSIWYAKGATSAIQLYTGNVDAEPTQSLVKTLGYIGRDLKKIAITDAEAALADTLIAACNNRHYGTGPLFGGVGGSTVSVA